MLATTPAAAAALDAGAPREPPRSHRVYCFGGASFTPTGFEIEGGKARNHKWRLSLRVLLPDGRRGVTLGQWLERHALEGAVPAAPGRGAPAPRAAAPPTPEPRPRSAGAGELPPPPAGAPAPAAEPALPEAPGAPAPPRAVQRADSRAPVISGTYFAGVAAAAAAAQAAARCEAPSAPPPAPALPAAAVAQMVLLEADALFEPALLEAADADADEALLTGAPVPPPRPPAAAAAAAAAGGGAFVGDADNGAAASLLPRLLPSRPGSRPGSAASAAERAALLLAPAAPPARPNFGSACGSGGIAA